MSETEEGVVLTSSSDQGEYVIAADQAIESTAEDRLNRAAFAEGIANAVSSWNGRHSVVVALYGSWGSGKTSILNMVREQVQKRPQPAAIVDFNPWEWSGHQELTVAFFEQVEQALRGTEGGKDAAGKLKRYVTLLHAGATLAGAVAPAVAALFLGLSLVGTVVATNSGSIGTAVGATLALAGAAGVLATHVESAMTRVARGLEQFDSGKEISLSQAKKELRAALLKLETPIVIIVDDLDRLTPPDTVRMLQIIKANADLPGLVFLISCDANSVADSIKAHMEVDGRSFLEKIVQVAFDVPAPDGFDLTRLLEQEIERTTDAPAIQKLWDKSQWNRLLLTGLSRYITTPRRAIRYASMADFGLRQHLSGGECHVHPMDFLAIEALREFEPQLYQKLPSVKESLTMTATTGDDQRTHDRARQTLEPILELAQPDTAEAAKAILRIIFPSVEGMVSDVRMIPDRSDQLRTRRVAHPWIFDRYFQSAIPSHDLAEAEVSEVIQQSELGTREMTEEFRKTSREEQCRPNAGSNTGFTRTRDRCGTRQVRDKPVRSRR